MKKMTKNLKYIFEPKSVAIVGASSTANSVGNILMKNLVDGKFPGAIYPINPKYKEILGVKCHNKLTDIKGRLDCVIIVTPAVIVPEIMKDCAKKKVGGIILITSGFEEVGRQDLAKQVKDIAEKNDIPVIGPNCLGVLNPYTKVDSIFLPVYKLGRPKPGSIAFVTQSGAVGSAITDLAAYYGIGISKFISYGNATVLDESDYLEYLLEDKETETIILYMEGAKDGRKLLETMKKVNKVKPIIVLKAGKGKGGQAAARSHTGNIAGSNMAYTAAFRQAKVTEADGINELFDFVKMFSQPKQEGKRIGVITNGGGMGVLTADYIEKEGLELAEFSETTKSELKKLLPSYGNVGNPLDLVADSGVNAYEKAVDIMNNAPEVDILVIIVLFQTPPIDERIVHVLTRVSDDRNKPVATISVGGEYTEAYRKILESNNVPNFNSPSGAIKAVGKWVEYSKYSGHLREK
ncbi:CoA-binding protein [Candidatus Micrarchaeota archaeon]|nr:CoA-binding protein [Candidatus Micrarchaeota archaeon]MBU1166395.1 CoA-binding protein [Candidatus Micrarchaeota archaeon]MBU1887173.1 CoA-binding protein [Candidatus Micrarchaeota archaeon]